MQDLSGSNTLVLSGLLLPHISKPSPWDLETLESCLCGARPRSRELESPHVTSTDQPINCYCYRRTGRGRQKRLTATATTTTTTHQGAVRWCKRVRSDQVGLVWWVGVWCNLASDGASWLGVRPRLPSFRSPPALTPPEVFSPFSTHREFCSTAENISVLSLRESS
ncbi:hypothetical protein F5148DRAFT_388170 [Russula earlei]|uniref:Uncharacterized protein n=1 Tax=Russula earlei TaxID=71964 RepID=A0ACC0U2I0_9AGAM|nr:hypothetical protein F5148DRAFT_388170 [Russula earlei]